MQEKNVRDCRFELMRIVAMLLIISTHFWGKCVDLKNIEPFENGYIFGWFVKGITLICINLYVLLSAYFLCKSKFKIKKLFSLWLEVEFYSIIMFAVGAVLGTAKLSFSNIIKVLLPVCNNEYWFITVYFGLYVLSPFINKGISSFNKKQMQAICIVLTVLFCVIPNVFYNSVWLNFGGGLGICWFITLYFIGSYLRIYGFPIKSKKTVSILAIVFLLLPGLSRIVLVLGEKAILGKEIGAGLFYFYNSITILPATVLVFQAFINIKPIESVKANAVINKLAKSSLAVYLIHDNPFTCNKFWGFVAKYVDLSSITYVLVFIISVLAIWLACTLIDFIRQAIFDLLLKEPIGTKIDKKINDIFSD